MTRLPALVGQRDDRGRALAPLSADVERTSAPGTRRRALAVLASLPPGTRRTRPAVAAELAWRSPRRGGQRADLVEAVLAEAETLGLTGRGALTSYGRELVGGTDEARVAALLDDRLPPPVDHVLVQADLTVVAPGPLETDLAREMALVADVESAGAATVYRVTEATVRRALDAGRAAAELHELFRSRSRTPIPQALTYLIDDVARRHGALRVGGGGELPALRRRGAAHRRGRGPPGGVAAAAPDRADRGGRPRPRWTGCSRCCGRPGTRRSASRPRARCWSPGRTPGGRRRGSGRPRATEPPAVGDAQLERAGAGDPGRRPGGAAGRDRSPASASAAALDVPGVTTATTLGMLRDAARANQAVLLGYVNAQGTASQRIVEPVSVNGGYLHGYDHQRDEMRTFALHRITAVSALPDDALPEDATETRA